MKCLTCNGRFNTWRLLTGHKIQGWQGRNGGADLRPAPRAPDRNPRPAPRAPVPSPVYPAPLARAGPAGYPDNYRGVDRVTYRVTVKLTHSLAYSLQYALDPTHPSIAGGHCQSQPDLRLSGGLCILGRGPSALPIRTGLINVNIGVSALC